jgi:hypothetical protein
VPRIALTVLCESGAHCRTCRDRDGGRKWRAGLAVAYAVPPDAPDFACPADLPWGYRGGLGDAAAAVIKAVMAGILRPCGPCTKRRAALNRLMNW